MCIQRNIKSRESTEQLIYPMPLIELTFLFDALFQEFKIKVKTGVFFFHVFVFDSNFAGSSIDLSAGKICRPRGTPGFFLGILPVAYRRICNGFLAFVLAVFSMTWDKIEYLQNKFEICMRICKKIEALWRRKTFTGEKFQSAKNKD